MGREFKYNPEVMKGISNELKKVSSNLDGLKAEFNGAKELISGMDSLGFLETKSNMIETIQKNTCQTSFNKLENLSNILNKNAADVSGTDEKIAANIKGGK